MLAGAAIAAPGADPLVPLAASLRPAAGATGPLVAGAMRAAWSETGALRYLGAPDGTAFTPPESDPERPPSAAASFLRAHRDLFGVPGEASSFEWMRTRARSGRRFVRFQQTYGGIPVFAAQATVQMDTLDGIEAVLADLATDTRELDAGRPSLLPRLGAAEAVARAVALARAESPDAEVESRPARLMLFVPEVLGSSGPSRLVWEVRVGARAGRGRSLRVLLDAQDGTVVRAYPLDYAALDRQVYDSHNTTATYGPLVRREGDPPCGIVEADHAYDYMGDTFLFYALYHARDAIDGQGGILRTSVRYCDNSVECPWNNAKWSDFYETMFFGDGWAQDDVLAHEYTHGVTSSESDLIYENASGAMNESFSDVWGEFVDLTNGHGTDGPTVRWLIGEDLALETLRSMIDPPAYGDPDRLSSPLFVPPASQPSANNDYGGVHTNSGVNNKLCALLTDGGSFNGQGVTGMGITAVARLYYEANANLLTSGADWIDLFNALRQAAVNLGWSQADRDNLYRACLAVEIAILVVDKTSTCLIESGLPTCTGFSGPFKTVTTGMNTMPAGATLTIRAGQYPEVLTLSKHARLKAEGGAVRIGP